MRIAVPLLVGVFVFLPALFSEGQQKEKPKWAPNPNVAATDPLRPAEQAKKLKLPPGFEIQLVAADPDIRKPININFDVAGRLWLTETIEYPYAAKQGEGRDAVKILEDFGPDGRARKITTFVDKLNIPIGVLPTAKGALVYSIPSIYHMVDSKGTGKADQRDVYYTKFGTNDTHGMTGEFQQGFDGWIYACHGFANTSNVKSRGDTGITMTSGNTYRIKADGSRIEQYTWGQVNPFGLAFDPNGNLYSGDCHSRPLTMLLRGGWYESFSRPNDGLGFAPHMNTFDGHSTALCGVSYYAADQYPKEWQGLLFLGDVVLNRINAYQLEWVGASPKAVMKPFVTSSDPWFRPVDIKLGPDGCLYFADFYNRIIGHYEVALDHPGRDRDKGRIWRIVYRGPDGTGGPQPVTNLATADVKSLVQALGHANLTVRLQATHQLAERGGNEAAAAVQPILHDVAKAGDGARKVHALWVQERLSKLSDDILAEASSATEKEVRVHAQRILTEKKNWSPKYSAMAKLGLEDADATVQRVAAEALAAHPAAGQAMAIIDRLANIDPNDNHMRYAVRLALRAQLRLADSWGELAGVSPAKKGHVADVCLGVHTEASADFLRAFVGEHYENVERVRSYIHYIARHGDKGTVVTWGIDFISKKFIENKGAQGSILKAFVQGLQERGVSVRASEGESLETLVLSLLEAPGDNHKQAGAELAGMLRFGNLQPQLSAMASKAGISDPLRKAAIAAMVAIDAKKAVRPLNQLLLDEKEEIAIREQVARALAATNHPEAHAALVQALQHAPARLQSVIALGMAGSGPGGNRLLEAIETGKASPRLLQDRAIEIRLQQANIGNFRDRFNKLTQGLPPADQKIQELISKRREGFASFKGDPAAGQKLFQKHCANCHQIANQGAKIGPQLDGIAARGLDRILEDILDPNRNVDQAFRTTLLTLKNGQTPSGLFLREEGNIVVLADNQGKDVRIDKSQIEERTVSPLSPMPSNFVEQMSEPDFRNLLAYLLSQKS